MAPKNPWQRPPMPKDMLYQGYSRGLYRITGEESTDNIMNLLSADNLTNSANVQTSASDIGSGVTNSTTGQAGGSLNSGKTTFDNSTTGYILGVDPSTGIPKFYIGSSTNYINWDGSTLTVTGSLNVTSINIPDQTTANSFHVDSSGNTWWGATTLAAAKASVLNTGVAMFAQGSSGTSALSLQNSSSNNILNLGNNNSIILEILPTNNDQGGILIQNASGLVSTKRMLEVDTANSSSTSVSVYISQAGAGSGLSVNAVNANQTNYLVEISGSIYLRNLLEISSSFNSNNGNIMLHVTALGASGTNTLMQLDNAGLGYGIYMTNANASNTDPIFFASVSHGGRLMELDQTNSSNANNPLYVTTTNTTVAPIFAAGGTVASHFNRMISSGGYQIWVSDGTTPNGNLSANIGDICLGGPSGHMFWNNNGSTGWTQI